MLLVYGNEQNGEKSKRKLKKHKMILRKKTFFFLKNITKPKS